MVGAVRQGLIGPRVRVRRTAIGLTQAALAARAGISTSYLNLIENNKRPVAGRLQIVLAKALEIETSTLSGAAEQKLADALALAAADPVLGGTALKSSDAAALVGHYPDWARLTARAVRAYREQAAQTVALTDRLAHDPAVAGAVHQMRTNIAAIRSTAEILTSVDDLPAEQTQRFHAIIDQQSKALSDVSATLAAVFDPTNAELRPVTGLDFIEDAFARQQNRLVDIEAAANSLRVQLGLNDSDIGADIETPLIRKWQALGLKLDQASAAATPSMLSPSVLSLPRTATTSANRAFLAFKLVERILERQISVEVKRNLSADEDGASASNAADDLKTAFTQYAADALLMPYVPFLKDAQRWRFDITALASAYDVDIGAIARRLTTLDQPAAPPFAMLAINPSGARIDRRRTLDIALPRFGAGCAIWAVHDVFGGDSQPHTQILEMPDGERLLAFAIGMSSAAPTRNLPPTKRAYMLATPIIHAGAITYGADVQAPLPAGICCELCPRQGCAYRAAAAILAQI